MYVVHVYNLVSGDTALYTFSEPDTANRWELALLPFGEILEVTFTALDVDEDYEGPTCSICDGLGHGYPGAGPCPLEDSGRYDSEPAWAV